MIRENGEYFQVEKREILFYPSIGSIDYINNIIQTYYVQSNLWIIYHLTFLTLPNDGVLTLPTLTSHAQREGRTPHHEHTLHGIPDITPRGETKSHTHTDMAINLQLDRRQVLANLVMWRMPCGPHICTEGDEKANLDYQSIARQDSQRHINARHEHLDSAGMFPSS